MFVSVTDPLECDTLNIQMQAKVNHNRELLAQLNEKYGDDLGPNNSSVSASENKVFDWRQTGNLVVDVLEGSMVLVPPRMGIRFKTQLILLGKQGSEMIKSTSWASGIAPLWNERLMFQHCSRHDVMVLQVLVCWFSESLHIGRECC